MHQHGGSEAHTLAPDMMSAARAAPPGPSATSRATRSATQRAFNGNSYCHTVQLYNRLQLLNLEDFRRLHRCFADFRHASAVTRARNSFKECTQYTVFVLPCMSSSCS